MREIYTPSALTGGTSECLDAISPSVLNDGDAAFVMTGSVLYVYEYQAAATDAENSPSRIRPDDYATSGVWYLQSVSADYSQMSRLDIEGGDITTSAQVITVTPCSCWDSTRSTFLQTLVNKTWTVPATNNLEVYLFIVRLNNGTIDIKGYSTYAGAASDVGVNITHYRFIAWNKNDGSGVLSDMVGKRGKFVFADGIYLAGAGALSVNATTVLGLSADLIGSMWIMQNGNPYARSYYLKADGITQGVVEFNHGYDGSGNTASGALVFGNKFKTSANSTSVYLVGLELIR